jgi:hypothetical protein
MYCWKQDRRAGISLAKKRGKFFVVELLIAGIIDSVYVCIYLFFTLIYFFLHPASHPAGSCWLQTLPGREQSATE